MGLISIEDFAVIVFAFLFIMDPVLKNEFHFSS